jgi:hypothetical protein
MGALSSWAMLAVTHHLLAQLAAWRSRSVGNPDLARFWIDGWYTGYEVLGDDIVFFDHYVADAYLLVMSEIGVPINLAKSVVAKNPTFEFAKVTGHYGRHVAAISWAQFMSQPTVMGRVGICFSILRKGIVKNHLIRYITRFSRQSRYEVGLPNLFYLGLASMFANSGVLKVSEVIHQVIAYREGKLTLVPALFEQSYGAIIRAFVSAVAGATLPQELISIPHKNVAFLDYSTQNLAVKTALVKTIVSFLYGSKSLDKPGYRVNALSPSNDAMTLAKSMVMLALDFPNADMESLGSALTAEGAFTMKPKVFDRLSPVGKFIHPLYCQLFFQVYTKLVRHWSELTKVKTINLRGLSLEELLKLMDHIDRYQELLILPQRALKKIRLESVPVRSLQDSPLKILIHILKAESRMDYMRGVVLNTGVEVITKIFAENRTAFYSIFDQPNDSSLRDHPDLKPHPGAIPIERIRAFVKLHGESFFKAHFPKWGRHAASMFKEPSDLPEYNHWNIYMAQPEYLYSMGFFDSCLGKGDVLITHYQELDPFENPNISSDSYEVSEE